MLIVIILSLHGCEDAVTSDSDDTIVLSMYSEDLKSEDDSFSSPVAKAITESTNVKLDIQYPIEGVSDRIDLMISSGVYPDLIMVKDTHKLVDADAYIDLGPLIEEHAPNLMDLYGDHLNRLRFSAEDPAIYVLPTKPVEQQVWEPVMGFQLQHAVVSELNYPELKTVKDFEKAIKDYIEKYPEIDGEPTIGISLIIDDWRWKISLSNSAGFATGAPDDGNWFIDPVTYEATYRFLREEEKEYYRWLNHMYNEGLIDPDSFVQKYDSYVAKIASGRVLALIDAKWQYSYGEKILKTYNKEERMYGQYPVQLDESTIAADFRDIGYIGGYGIGISEDCKYPIKAIKFLDFMASERGHLLRLWGIEGVHYYYDDDGTRKITKTEQEKRLIDPDYFKKTGISVYAYPFPVWGIGKKDSTGNYYNPDSKEAVVGNYSDIEKDVLANYGASTWADLYPSADELKKSVWGEAWDIPIPSDSPIRYQLQECDNIMRSGLIRVIIEEPEEFDIVWEELMKQLEEQGVHSMGEEFTKLVKERIELWK